MNIRIHYWKHYLLMITFVIAFGHIQALGQTYVNAPLSQANTTGEVYHESSIILSSGFTANGTTGSFHAFISTTLPVPVSFSNDKNYVSQWIPQISVKTAEDLKALENHKERVGITVQYIDELGRTIQSIQKSSTPLGVDVVQHYEYDEQSLQPKTYLPYAAGDGLGGSFRGNAQTAQHDFYNNGSTTIAQTNSPYSKVLTEVSPLQRLLEKGKPGDAWQLTNDPAANSGHTAKFAYLGNNTVSIDDVANTMMAMRYDVSFDGSGNRSITCAGNYDVNDLFVTIAKGSNWVSADGRAGQAETYTDKSGRTVLKRVFTKNTSGGIDMLSTYYVYDDFGKLCYVLTPGADPDHPNLSGGQPIANDALNKFCYQYVYDLKQRLAQKRQAGKDWEYFAYDVAGHLVAVQDGNQHSRNEWGVSKYDQMGRKVITGTWNNSNTAIPRDDLQYILDHQLWASTVFETRGTDAHGYTNVAWPQNMLQYYSVNYYDDYNVNGFPSGLSYQAYAGNPNGADVNTENQVTVKKTWPLSNFSAPLWEVQYYDDKGEIIQRQKTNKLAGADIYNFEYAFNGNIIRDTRQHTTTSATVTVKNRYTYDHANRPLQHFEQIGSDPEVMLKQMAYNELGQAINKKLHQKTGSNGFMQSVDYRYNIRGWLTSINDPSLTTNNATNPNDPASDADKYGITYNYDQAAIPQYNGNIGGISWANASAGGMSAPVFKYDYRYDKINRLTEAVSSTGGTKDANFAEYASYDAMGNFKTLGRWARLAAGRVQVDSLKYYYNGNQVNQIDDLSGNNVYGFHENPGGVSSQTANEYAFDLNGNLTQDLNKGITAITYNNFQLPASITWSSGKTLVYDYDGTGTMLTSTYTAGTSITTTDYVNDIQYRQGQLYFIATSEGLAIRNPSGGNYVYNYELKDILGSTRVVLQPTGSSETTATIVQVSNYYPYGLEYKSDDPNTLFSYVNGDKDGFLFNGKEQQIGTDDYNYGARQYDPATGRWTVFDNLADEPEQISRSPYAYAWNNPVTQIDPDGNCPWCAVAGAVIGGVVNLATHWKGTSIAQKFAAFGVGAAAGAISGLTLNPALFTGLTAVGAAAASGAIMGAVSSTLLGAGNYAFFQERFSFSSVVQGVLVGAAGGAVGKLLEQAFAPAAQSVRTAEQSADNFVQEANDLVKGQNLQLAEDAVQAGGTNTTTTLAHFWPPNEGALGAWEETSSVPGQLMDRYGNPYGTYASPVGTPFNMRALSPSTNVNDYIKFEVLKSFPMKQSFIAPTAWDVGLGIQYKLPMSVNYLEYYKYIKIIKP